MGGERPISSSTRASINSGAIHLVYVDVSRVGQGRFRWSKLNVPILRRRMLPIACRRTGSQLLLPVRNPWWEGLHGHRWEYCTKFSISCWFPTRIRRHTPFKSPCTTMGLHPCRYKTPELICTSCRWLNDKMIADFKKASDIQWIIGQQKDYVLWGIGLECRYRTTGRSLQWCHKTVRHQIVGQCCHAVVYAMQQVRLEGAWSPPSIHC